MKLTKKLAVIASSFAIASSAQAIDLSGLYGGVSYLAEVNHDEARISSATDVRGDQKDSGYGLFIGYQLNDIVGLELAYRDLGEAVTDYNNGDGTRAKITTERQHASLDLVLGKEVYPNLRLFAKVGYGVLYADTNGTDPVTTNAVTAIIGESLSDQGANYGLGAQYNFGKMFVRAEYEQLPEAGYAQTLTSWQGPASEPEVYSVSFGASF